MPPNRRRWRLAVCLSHPVQYKVPLAQRLAAHPDIEQLKVYFYSDTGLVERPDPYRGMTAKWDIPLLEGYEYEFLPAWRINRERTTGYFNPTLFLHLLRESWDGILIHSYQYPSDWLAWLAAKLRNTAVLFHGEMYPRTYPKSLRRSMATGLKKLMLRHGTNCLAIGSVAAQVYQDLNVPSDRIFLAPYAVNNEFFMSQAAIWRPRQAELKEELGIPPDIPVVLCVAGMYPKKRQIDLIAAMAQLETPARLVLVGRGPLLDEVSAFCQQHLPQAILTGFKNQTELPRSYAVADIFVLPSLWEEFGLVVNEAMCFGLPLIVSNTAASSQDLLCSGENGFTFPPGDINALAHCLEILLDDASLRRRFGNRSLEIISVWNYDRAIQGILTALERHYRLNHPKFFIG